MIVNIPKNKDDNNHGYIFALIRMVNNYKVSTVADKCNMSRQYINHLEKQSLISNNAIFTLCHVYDITELEFKKIHYKSKIKYKFDYLKTLRLITEYYIDKQYFMEDC